jgi:hypothetical protein
MLTDLKSIKAEGFEGFVTVADLMSNHLEGVPLEQGVYLVLRPNLEAPAFMEKSTGGHFNGQDPTVAIDELEMNWVNGAITLYIGKAGGPSIAATLQSRLRQFLDFGAGQPVGHRGGRFVWQLRDADKLVIAWKVAESKIPR